MLLPSDGIIHHASYQLPVATNPNIDNMLLSTSADGQTGQWWAELSENLTSLTVKPLTSTVNFVNVKPLIS
jgi:hypothetical protein